MSNKDDLIRDCMASAKISSGDDNVVHFMKVFCKRCYNSNCKRSESGWSGRMASQVEKILENPNIAPINDPRFREIMQQNFKDMRQEQMRLEVASRRGDWLLPEDIPSGFQAEEEALEEVEVEGFQENLQKDPAEVDQALSLLLELRKVRDQSEPKQDVEPTTNIPNPVPPLIEKETPRLFKEQESIEPKSTQNEVIGSDPNASDQSGRVLVPKHGSKNESTFKDPWAVPTHVNEKKVEKGLKIKMNDRFKP